MKIAISLLFLTLANLHAQDTARPMNEAGLAKVEERVTDLVKNGKIAGAVTMVARDGVTVQSGAYGVRSVGGDTEMTTDTIFRIYSMSKPITTAAAMMLVEEGKIALDDPLSKHLPKLSELKVFSSDGNHKPAKRQPTVRDLMRHTSGFSYGFLGGEVASLYNKAKVLDRDSSIDAMVEKLSKLPLQDEPGTVWRYSISTDVLGAVVQAASGMKFEDFLSQRVFEPLGMVDTAFYVPAEKANRFASQHGRGLAGKLFVSEAAAGSQFLKSPGLPSGGGGLCSTAADYMRFCQMILGEGELAGKRLLKASSITEMTKNQLPDGIDHIGIGDVRSGVGFGLGFAVRMEESAWGFGGKTGELGWGGAASTHFWLLPEEGLAVVTLRNFMPYQWTLEKELKSLVYGALQSGG